MAAAESTSRRELNRKREKARAERALRAATASAAWQASGKDPWLKGKGKTKRGEKRREPLPDDVLTHDEVRGLLDACGASTTGIRNAAMVALLYGSAVRISEACGIYPADLTLAGAGTPGTLDGASVFIRARKGGEHDSVGMGAPMIPYLVAWTERRVTLGLNGRDPFFCAISGDSRGNPTGASYWRHLLPRLAEKAGIEGKRCHPHGLRRTAATHMRDAGIPLDVIQRQLGHKNLASTAHYLGPRADAEHRRIISAHGAEVAGDDPSPTPDAAAMLGAVVSPGTPGALFDDAGVLARLAAVEREHGAGTVSQVLAALYPPDSPTP